MTSEAPKPTQQPTSLPANSTQRCNLPTNRVAMKSHATAQTQCNRLTALWFFGVARPFRANHPSIPASILPPPPDYRIVIIVGWIVKYALRNFQLFSLFLFVFFSPLLFAGKFFHFSLSIALFIAFFLGIRFFLFAFI